MAEAPPASPARAREPARRTARRGQDRTAEARARGGRARVDSGGCGPTSHLPKQTPQPWRPRLPAETLRWRPTRRLAEESLCETRAREAAAERPPPVPLAPPPPPPPPLPPRFVQSRLTPGPSRWAAAEAGCLRCPGWRRAP